MKPATRDAILKIRQELVELEASDQALKAEDRELAFEAERGDAAARKRRAELRQCIAGNVQRLADLRLALQQGEVKLRGEDAAALREAKLFDFRRALRNIDKCETKGAEITALVLELGRHVKELHALREEAHAIVARHCPSVAWTFAPQPLSAELLALVARHCELPEGAMNLLSDQAWNEAVSQARPLNLIAAQQREWILVRAPDEVREEQEQAA